MSQVICNRHYLTNCQKKLLFYTCISQSGNDLLQWGGVAYWVARLARNVKVVGSSPIKGRCFIEQNTLPLLLSTSWFERVISQSN